MPLVNRGSVAKVITSIVVAYLSAARRGGALDLVYRYQPRPGFDAQQLVAALNSVADVDSATATFVS